MTKFPKNWHLPHPDLDAVFEEEKDIAVLKSDIIRPKQRSILGNAIYHFNRMIDRIFNRKSRYFDW